MDGGSSDTESLKARIRQLEQERDELHKDIEQLCMQQAGPSYLGIATKMHFQRIAGLEQEIESLKKQLALCLGENRNLKEELSEAYRIKSQLADLHGAEVAKNLEAEKQLKFFQGCVASAFAERDNSVMEAEKAKEKEDFLSKNFGELQRRIEELTSDCSAQKELSGELQVSLEVKEEQNETFKKIIDKFYQIREQSTESCEDTSWDIKCACLLHDSAEMWSFNDASTAKYISALEEKLEMMRKSADNLQNKLQVGLEIENHLKRKVREFEKKIIQRDKTIINRIAELHRYHSECRVHILNMLDDGNSLINSTVDVIGDRIRQLDKSGADISVSSPTEVDEDEHECRDVHINTDVEPDLLSKVHVNYMNNLGFNLRRKIMNELHNEWIGKKMKSTLDNPPDLKEDDSEALALAMQQKVAALLLLSQQEERHMLDGDVNSALQRKIEELQRNLLQVTNEKVRALMEMAQLKQDYQMLKEKVRDNVGMEKVNVGVKAVDNSVESGGRLTNLLKKTNLKRWIDLRGSDAELNLNNNMDYARLKIENATFKESMESMEHLITSIHRLRLSLVKGMDSAISEDRIADEIINEAKLVKTALGSYLPVSWSAEADPGAPAGESISDEPNEKRDSVTAAGFEMVELLILAAQLLKKHKPETGS